MKNITLDIKTIVILALLGVILFMRFCDGGTKKPGDTINVNGQEYEVIENTTDTVLIVKDTTIYRKGKDIYHDTTIYVPVLTPIDTNSVIRDYYSLNLFRDSLTLSDSLGTISLVDTISKNKIQGRLWSVTINEKLIKNKLIVKELPKNQVYIGANVGFSRENVIHNFGPSLLLKTKSDKIYSLGINLNQNKAITLQGGIYWKIKLKK